MELNKEEPPHAQSLRMDKLTLKHNPVSPCSLFGNSLRAGQKEAGSFMLFGVHHSGCYRHDYLLVSDGGTK